jgi:hypothetical protein
VSSEEVAGAPGRIAALILSDESAISNDFSFAGFCPTGAGRIPQGCAGIRQENLSPKKTQALSEALLGFYVRHMNCELQAFEH